MSLEAHFLSDKCLESLMVVTTIEISEAGVHDGERRAVPVDDEVVVLEMVSVGILPDDQHIRIYEQRYQFSGRAAKDGTPIYIRYGERQLRDA